VKRSWTVPPRSRAERSRRIRSSGKVLSLSRVRTLSPASRQAKARPSAGARRGAPGIRPTRPQSVTAAASPQRNAAVSRSGRVRISKNEQSPERFPIARVERLLARAAAFEAALREAASSRGGSTPSFPWRYSRPASQPWRPRRERPCRWPRTRRSCSSSRSGRFSRCGAPQRPSAGRIRTAGISCRELLGIGCVKTRSAFRHLVHPPLDKSINLRRRASGCGRPWLGGVVLI